jgi:hypothetical protein
MLKYKCEYNYEYKRGYEQMALEQLAKKSKKEETTVITARLANSKYNWLKKYCDDLGISINEAINFLLDVEYKEWAKKNKNVIQENEVDISQMTIEEAIRNESENEKDDEIKVNTKVNTNIDTDEIKERFVYEPYMNHDNKVPCPICEKFYSKSNYVRHTNKQHEMTPEEVLTSKIYQDKIKAMLEAKEV